MAGDDIDTGPDSIAVKLTRGQIAAWAGYELDGDQLDQLEEAIPNSSIPEAIATIAQQFREDDADPVFGRCDTCGGRCDEDGCTTDRSHEVALDVSETAAKEDRRAVTGEQFIDCSNCTYRAHDVDDLLEHHRLNHPHVIHRKKENNA